MARRELYYKAAPALKDAKLPPAEGHLFGPIAYRASIETQQDSTFYFLTHLFMILTNI